MKGSLNTKYQFANVFYFATFASMLAFASNYMLDLGFSNSTIGVVMAAYSIVSVFLQPALADFADKHPNIPIRVLIGRILLVMAGLSLLLYFAGIFLGGNFIILILIVVIFSLLNSSMPLFNTMAFIYEKYGVKINYGVARGLGSAAYACVSMGLGYILDWSGPSILPLAYVLFIMLTFLVVRSYVLKSAKVQRQARHEHHAPDKKISFLAFFGKYKAFIILLFGFMFVYSDHMLINNFYIQVITSVGGTSANMGLAVFIAAMMELPCMFGFNQLNKKLGIKNLLRIAMVFSVVKHFMTWMATSMVWIYAAAFVQGLAYAIYIPALVYYVNDVVSQSDLLMGQSINTMFMTLGGVVGSLLGGVLMDALGTKNALLAGAVLTAVGALIVFAALQMPGAQKKTA